jgi:tetratricopeptide (TPR) repeat protein
MRAREGQADCEDAIAQLLSDAEAATERPGRVDCLQKAADIYESQLGDLEKAAAVWHAAFAEDFVNERSGQALERLAERRGCGAQLATDLRALLPETTEPRQRAALSAWVGRWLTRFTEDRAAGEAYLLEALRLDPSSTVAEKTLRVLADEPMPPETTPVPERAAYHGTAAGNAARVPDRTPDQTPIPGGSQIIVVRPAPASPPSAPLAQPAQPPQPTMAVGQVVVASTARHQRPTPIEVPSSTIIDTQAGPEGTEALHRRLDSLVEESRWAEAVDVLKALGSNGDPVMRAKYLTTAAKIVHHKLGNDAEAVELFNRALDAHPDDLAVFERLYQILAGRRAWREVESNLLRMIARIKADDALEKAPTLEALWRRLGDIYRVGLEDPVSATNAYQMCARLAPHDPRYPTMITQLSTQLSTQLPTQLAAQVPSPKSPKS